MYGGWSVVVMPCREARLQLRKSDGEGASDWPGPPHIAMKEGEADSRVRAAESASARDRTS